MWNHKTPGIPDEEFERTEDVPITKEEARVIQISKARLSEGNLVYDIGCGSGSITVEAGIQIGKTGKIYAIDMDPKAIDLTRKNLGKFGIANVELILA
ncbi:MAG: methyltransferase domain-containing protein, partial [Nitrosopumilaceae archaeon]|nr:methyltransferase domain-containing protein [Nitrosopumilaceae archaeon]